MSSTLVLLLRCQLWISEEVSRNDCKCEIVLGVKPGELPKDIAQLAVDISDNDTVSSQNKSAGGGDTLAYILDAISPVSFGVLVGESDCCRDPRLNWFS